MGSSLGFGSMNCNYLALFRLAFAAAPELSSLNLAAIHNSPVHSSIGTPSASYGPRTACRHTVSGSISLPSRGSFHLSLTVLVLYRSQGVFSLGGWSPLLPAGFLVPRGTRVAGPGRYTPFAYGTFTPYGEAFQPTSTRCILCNCPAYPQINPASPLYPHAATTAAFSTAWVWAPPRSLAATWGISLDFFYSGYLDVSVPPLTFSRPMCSAADDTALPVPGFPIRISPDLCPLAAPRGFSQPATSFFGSLRQGIHRVPFLTCHYRPVNPLSLLQHLNRALTSTSLSFPLPSLSRAPYPLFKVQKNQTAYGVHRGRIDLGV